MYNFPKNQRSNNENGMTFGLKRWLEKQEKLRIQLEQSVRDRNFSDQQQLMLYLIKIASEKFDKLNNFERSLILTLTTMNDNFKNWSPKQRSSVAMMYVKYFERF